MPPGDQCRHGGGGIYSRAPQCCNCCSEQPRAHEPRQDTACRQHGWTCTREPSELSMITGPSATLHLCCWPARGLPQPMPQAQPLLLAAAHSCTPNALMGVQFWRHLAGWLKPPRLGRLVHELGAHGSRALLQCYTSLSYAVSIRQTPAAATSTWHAFAPVVCPNSALQRAHWGSGQGTAPCTGGRLPSPFSEAN